MPIDYYIDKDRGCTICVWHDHVAAIDIEKHILRLMADADWPSRKLIHLMDLRKAKLDVSINEEILLKTAKTLGERLTNQRVKLAMVAESNYEKALFFEKEFMKYQPSAIIFYDLHSACMWLGLSDFEVERIIEKMLSKKN